MERLHPFDVYDKIANEGALCREEGFVSEVVSVPGGESYLVRRAVLRLNGVQYIQDPSVPYKYNLLG